MNLRIHVCRFVCILVAAGAVSPAWGQAPEPVPLTIYPQSAALSTALRLLPADPDLKKGNAAVVMLRMIWEQQPFMQHVAPQFVELLKLPYDDPRILDDFRFGRFQSQLRRAAYMRDAQWDYPLGEEPLAMILLPDVQGFRQFVGRGMSLWIGQQIAKKDFAAAREGILVQLACARHVARTPLVVNRLVAIAMAEQAQQKAELLIQQPDSQNLYWALAMLPDSLGDNQAALQWNSLTLSGSLPSLAAGMPARGSDAWQQVAAEFSEFMVMEMGRPLSPEAGAAMQKRLLQLARKSFAEDPEATTDEMSDEEIVMRWVLKTTRSINDEFELAFSLPPAAAIEKLRALEVRIAELKRETGSEHLPLLEKPANIYVVFHLFDRRMKLLQTVESIRDFAAHHDGALPPSLEALALPAPMDPLTNQPFEYQLNDGHAMLRMGSLPDFEAAVRRQASYRLTVAQP